MLHGADVSTHSMHNPVTTLIRPGHACVSCLPANAGAACLFGGPTGLSPQAWKGFWSLVAAAKLQSGPGAMRFEQLHLCMHAFVPPLKRSAEARLPGNAPNEGKSASFKPRLAGCLA